MNNSIHPSSNPDRRVVEGVPRVGFYPDVKDNGGKPWPEDFIFPSCLRAVLEFHGDTQTDYVHLMGVSGAGFFLNWGGWTGDNVALYYMSADLGEVFTRTFDVIGYGSRVTHCGQPGEHCDELRAMILAEILAEIDAGRPCLCHGVVGPPETSIITGYDEGGDVLIGWSFFQTWPAESEGLTFEPNGYFRKRDWETSTWDVITVDERVTVPDRTETFVGALQWGLTVARTPTRSRGNHRRTLRRARFPAPVHRAHARLPTGLPDTKITR